MWVNKSVSAGFAVCSRGIAFLQASLGCKSGSFFFFSFFLFHVSASDERPLRQRSGRTSLEVRAAGARLLVKVCEF